MDVEEVKAFRDRCSQCAAVSWGLTDEGKYYCTSCHNVTDCRPATQVYPVHVSHWRAPNNLVPGLGPVEVQEDSEGTLFHLELHGKKKKRIVSDAKATEDGARWLPGRLACQLDTDPESSSQPDCSRCTASPPIVQVARINLHQETF